jgi:hypothetical protein
MDDQTNNLPAAPVDQPEPADDALTADLPDDDDKDYEAVESVKRQAVDALLPIVDQVEGSPEYRFEMLMNATTASPSTVLLQKTMDAASQIENPSIKAQALVDVLNLANSI